MTIQQLRRNLSALNVQEIAVSSVEKTKDSIADLNVMQMNKGLRADGSKISPSYAPLTRMLKSLKGLDPDTVTLRDTGAFQTAITTKVQGLEIITGSSDEKSEKLERKYSKKKGGIFGLSEKFKQEYIKENLRPEFGKEMRDKIFGHNV